MSATINGKKIAAMSYNGKKIASAWRDGQLVWSGAQPLEAGGSWEKVFAPNRSVGATLSSHLNSLFNGAVVVRSGDYSLGNGMESAMRESLTMISQLSSASPVFGAPDGGGLEPSSEWIISMKLAPKYTRQAGFGIFGSKYPTSNIGFGLFGDGEMLVENYLTTARSDSKVTISGTVHKGGNSPLLPAKINGGQYGETAMWYRDGKIRFYHNSSLVDTFSAPKSLERAHILPAIYAPGIRYKFGFPAQSFYSPPPIKFLSAYTGQEARTRAQLWGWANEAGEPTA